jgi:hypothetical protein
LPHVRKFLPGLSQEQAVVTGDLVHHPLQAKYPELYHRGDIDQKQGGNYAAQLL